MDASSLGMILIGILELYKKQLILVMVVLVGVDGMPNPPNAYGPQWIAGGKCSLRPRAGHFARAIIFSIFCISCGSYRHAIIGYSTPGSSIVVIAVHFAVFFSLLCLILPIYSHDLVYVVVICVCPLPFGANIAPSIHLAVLGSTRSMLVCTPVEGLSTVIIPGDDLLVSQITLNKMKS